ncbi:unnamed protein product [Rhizophagus irregularis]|uniref:Treble clef zinc finger domain-containing protein n=1 Tax=Rhizophagus irregularis TaxID=588596 RepID=A0A915ZC38_9GLOM|nr:unnamed protein product [Rhizophagus irregularis]
MQWKCTKDYLWTATFDSIKYQRSWCLYCAKQAKNTLDITKMVAINKGRNCISNEYINSSSYLRWKCAKGYEWNATLETQKCNGNCLSDSYKDAHFKIVWNCSKGHIWNATFANVKYQGSWCPFCQNKHENICREIVTNYLGPPSENCWPDFLKTPKYSRGLQLDIFYPKYGFAIEVQEEQHGKIYRILS